VTFTRESLREVTGDLDGPPCHVCGAIMVLGSEVTGTHIVFNNHWKCLSCGNRDEAIVSADQDKLATTQYSGRGGGTLARLSEKHQRVRDFILNYQDQHDGEPPSQKTVYLALGLRSWQVSRYIRKLERVGALKRPGYEAPKAKAFGA
jgi:hypothetical protein